MKAKTRIHSFLNRQHVNIKELAIRFLADSNLHSISCIITDADPDYVKTEEVTVTKKSGRFVITHEVARYEPFYGTETEVFKPHSTHNIKSVKALLSNLLMWDITETDLIDQHGKKADLRIVRIADK